MVRYSSEPNLFTKSESNSPRPDSRSPRLTNTDNFNVAKESALFEKSSDSKTCSTFDNVMVTNDPACTTSRENVVDHSTSSVDDYNTNVHPEVYVTNQVKDNKLCNAAAYAASSLQDGLMAGAGAAALADIPHHNEHSLNGSSADDECELVDSSKGQTMYYVCGGLEQTPASINQSNSPTVSNHHESSSQDKESQPSRISAPISREDALHLLAESKALLQGSYELHTDSDESRLAAGEVRHLLDDSHTKNGVIEDPDVLPIGVYNYMAESADTNDNTRSSTNDTTVTPTYAAATPGSFSDNIINGVVPHTENIVPVTVTTENSVTNAVTNENTVTNARINENIVTNENTVHIALPNQNTVPIDVTHENTVLIAVPNDNTVPNARINEDTVPNAVTNENTVPIAVTNGNTVPNDVPNKNTVPNAVTNENPASVYRELGRGQSADPEPAERSTADMLSGAEALLFGSNKPEDIAIRRYIDTVSRVSSRTSR